MRSGSNQTKIWWRWVSLISPSDFQRNRGICGHCTPNFLNLTSIFRRKKTHRKQKSKNKTHKKFEKFAFKFGFRYKAHRHEGHGHRDQQRDGERSREALGESKGRAVCTCYDALG